MNCPKCNNKSVVLETRSVELNVYRKRKCGSCGHKFYTEETETDDISGFKYHWYTMRVKYRGQK